VAAFFWVSFLCYRKGIFVEIADNDRRRIERIARMFEGLNNLYSLNLH
jgi:hypothetical protein